MHYAEAVSGVQKVVCAAKQAKVPRISCAEPGKRFDVVKLEKGSGSAAPTVGRNE